jgi:hypothetical protein
MWEEDRLQQQGVRKNFKGEGHAKIRLSPAKSQLALLLKKNWSFHRRGLRERLVSRQKGRQVYSDGSGVRPYYRGWFQGILITYVSRTINITYISTYWQNWIILRIY